MVGEKIRNIRKSKGLTQEALAEKLGVKRSVISKYENGMICPSFDQVVRISEILRVSMFEILDDYFYNYDFVDDGNSGIAYAEKEIIRVLRCLNGEGRIEAYRRISELAKIPEYQRKDVSDT